MNAVSKSYQKMDKTRKIRRQRYQTMLYRLVVSYLLHALNFFLLPGATEVSHDVLKPQRQSMFNLVLEVMCLFRPLTFKFSLH